MVLEQNLGQIMSNVVKKVKKQVILLGFFNILLGNLGWSMLGNSINIKNFHWNSVVLKFFLLKPLKVIIFWPKLCKNGVTMGHAQIKKQIFFSEIITPDPELSKPFYFNKIP